jgi:Uma2 family endonuclease
MIDEGILQEDERLELIEGEIVEKMPIGERHVEVVRTLSRFLYDSIPATRGVINVQNPIRLARSEPEPDLSVLTPKRGRGKVGKGGPGQILLVIEVAETSLNVDRETKLPVYAAARVPDYWIVNLVDACVEVYRKPTTRGTYREIQLHRPGAKISPLAFPEATLQVAHLF